MYAVIIGLNDFPDNDAGAVRDLAFAKIYQQLGYDVIVISQGRHINTREFVAIAYLKNEKRYGLIFRFILV